MDKIYASIKVSNEELDATNGYTVGERYTPFLQKLIKQVEEKANGEKFTWYLYDRFLNGPEGDVVLILQNQELSKNTKFMLKANLVATFNSNWEVIKPIK